MFFRVESLVFCCFITKFHKLISLKQHPFNSSQVLSVRNLGMAHVGPELGVSQGWNQAVGRADLLSGVQGPLPSSFWKWQNSIACNHKSEIPVFLLSASQGFLSAPRGPSKVLSVWPPHFKAKTSTSNPHASNLTILSATRLPGREILCF